MYFASRMQAGRMLASQIAEKYQGQPCAVLALSDGGVVVGAQIAQQLRSVIGMLLIDEIEVPQEMVAIAGITSEGSFAYNHMYAPGELEEMISEYRGYIEQEKISKLREMAGMIGKSSLIRPELLTDKVVILVADGFSNGFSIDLAVEYLKPIALRKLVVATPLASVSAVDRIHIAADDIFCLSVLENYMSTDHYYDTQDVPSHQVVIETVSNIVDNWQ